MAPPFVVIDDEEVDACEALGLTPALFWGICDVKYDPRLPERERVRVLELGDGRASRFSGHGLATREKFRHEYCIASHYRKLDVLMENKQLTHDRFVAEGLAHLRPRAACYPRRYEQSLASRVREDLQVQEGEAVVLKLCNRNRGAGVVVVPAEQLDGRLQRLLSPPVGADLEALLERRAQVALSEEPSGDFEEQCLHWWSNEHPCFLAEACCHSLPVAADESSGGAPGSGKVFDGTLRVAFALRRPEQGSSEGDGEDKDAAEVDWLGGYWKLPRSAVGSEGEAGAGEARDQDSSLEACRAQIVSSFSSATDKRTAEVKEEHLREVYAVLAPALLKLLRVIGTVDNQSLLSNYKSSPLVRAFVVARASAGMRRDKMRQARGLLDMARGWMRNDKSKPSRGLPERSALSYIERNIAVCSLMELQSSLSSSGKLRRAEAFTKINAALDELPTNASALFVKGRCFHDYSEFDRAADCFRKAIALDPDFKMSYLALGNCALHMGDYRLAVDASLACLRRHDSPTAQFNLGQAYYRMLLADAEQPEGGAAELRRLASDALTYAKTQDFKTWRPTDEAVLKSLLAAEGTGQDLAKLPLNTRKVHGWRP